MNISRHDSREITLIGHYEILDCIGHGGMGLVYRARDTRLDRQVAIKCLRAELFEKHYRERFRREALLLAKLNHPNIVQIYDYLETDEQLALVMEYVDGQNLQIQLREQIVPLKQRMQWLVQIAQGLAVAHDAGIIHRDLKTENILINKRNTAKISDLGIAKSQDFNATLTEHVAGSYCSMSPEQAMGEELDFKSDLFSFGILAYQLLCGSHPFGKTDNKLQLMQRIISHPPIPPTKCNPDLPAEICTLLGQLLSKNTSNRPDNTHWVAGQLEKLGQAMVEASSTKHDTEILGSEQAVNVKGNSDIRVKQKAYREHPTFDPTSGGEATRKLLRAYLGRYKFALLVIGLVLVFASGWGIWQLQPEPTRFVAVMPPTLTASGMHETQQELVKGAVFDAIQQRVIQLDGYYLIPRNEIAEVNGDIETVRRATAADELITTEIHCKIEACTITLSRLTPEGNNAQGRLRVQDTRTVDVLTDNYLSVITMVQNSLAPLYSEKVANSGGSFNEHDYVIFLETHRSYRTRGASDKLLVALDQLQTAARDSPATQSLYSDISLDLYHDTKNSAYLDQLETFMINTSEKTDIHSLKNVFYLQIAQGKTQEAEKTIALIQARMNSLATANELLGYLMMAKKEYPLAINYYKKALASRRTSNTLYYISIAYWYSGNTQLASAHIQEALSLSPLFSKANSLSGAIDLLEGDIDGAKVAFNKVIKQQPTDALNFNNLGLCYLLLGDYEKAFSLFDRATRLAPHNPLFLLNKADARNLAGDLDEARQMYLSLLSQLSNPDNRRTEDLRLEAQSYAHLGKFSDALKTLQVLEKTNGQNIETIYTAALIHTLASNNQSALLNIENALKNGMNKIWFTFSWFDKLCSETHFDQLMKNYGERNRCAAALPTAQ